MHTALLVDKLYCPKCGTEAMTPNPPYKVENHQNYVEMITKPLEFQCVQTYCKTTFWGVIARPALTRQEGESVLQILKAREIEEERLKKETARV